MMNRPQRQVKASKRLIEEDDPKPKGSLNVRLNDNPSVDVDDIIPLLICHVLSWGVCHNARITYQYIQCW